MNSAIRSTEFIKKILATKSVCHVEVQDVVSVGVRVVCVRKMANFH